MLIIRTCRPGPAPIINHKAAFTTITTHIPRQLHHALQPLDVFNKEFASPHFQYSTHLFQTRFHTTASIMGKKKTNGEYNDFLDGEKLHDNNEVRTSLQGASTQDISPPPIGQDRRGSKRHGKVKSGPKKPQLTHFLCLPLVTDTSRVQLKTGLERLKNDLEQDQLVPAKAVRPVGTIHLTLGVMSLDETQLEGAKHFLQSMSLHRILRDLTQRQVAQRAAEDGTISENLNAAAMPDTDSLTINLESLVPMQSPHKTSILYASPKDTTQRLVPFATLLKKEFTERGFMVEDTRPLKLHATIINTIYAKSSARRGRKSTVKETLKHIEHKVSPHHHADDNASVDGASEEDGPNDTNTRSEGHGPDAKSWMRFDASSLIERYKDFTWAQDVRIDRVQICKMGAKKIWSGEEVVDERYEVVYSKAIFD
jgi:activating signal cointegrator complex subunit 1